MNIQKKLGQIYRDYQLLCGVDEVGRGCLAGPVVAAAVIMPKDRSIIGVKDSKKLTAKERNHLNTLILDQALAYGYGVVDNLVIDEINIKQASRQAMVLAVQNLCTRWDKAVLPDILLIDAETIAMDIRQMAIIHGDNLCYPISCASIIAKVYRDAMFVEYDRIYPGYSFLNNKGYGTKQHYEGLAKHGLTNIHRRSFLKKLEQLDML